MMQQPQMPGQAAPTMSGLFSAMQAKQGVQQPVPSTVDSLVKLPPEVLKQLYMNPPEGVPTYAIIAARDKQIKMQQMREAQQLQSAQQQLAQQPRTVAEGVMGTVNAAQGGLMRVQGFQAGGATRADDTLASVGGVPIFSPREGPEPGETRAQYAARKRREAEEADEVANRPLRRAFRGVMDYFRTPPEQRLPILDALTQGRISPAPAAGLAAAAGAAAAPARAATAQTYPEPAAVREGRRAAPPAANQAPPPPRQTPPPPAARPPAAPPPAQAPGLASALPPGVTPFSIEDYMRQVRGAGNVPEDEKALREALLKSQEARLTRRAQQREEYGRSLDQTPEERRQAAIAAMLGGARGAKSLGEFLSGAAQGVAGFETTQREQQRQLRKELMTLEDAEDTLRQAMLEKQLAYRSGDRERIVAAEIKASEALRDYQFKLASEGREEEKVKAERDLRAAQKLTAEAELKRAQQGGGRESRVDPGQVSAIRALLEAANKVANDQLAPEPARRAAAAQAARYEAQLARLGGITVDTAPTGAGDVPPPGAVQRVR